MAKHTPATTPAKAYARYEEPIKEVLRCVTSDCIINSAHPAPDKELTFAFRQNPARLRDSSYALFLVQKVKIIQDTSQPGCWKVKTLSYEYNLERWD